MAATSAEHEPRECSSGSEYIDWNWRNDLWSLISVLPFHQSLQRPNQSHDNEGLSISPLQSTFSQTSSLQLHSLLQYSSPYWVLRPSVAESWWNRPNRPATISSWSPVCPSFEGERASPILRGPERREGGYGTILIEGSKIGETIQYLWASRTD